MWCPPAAMLPLAVVATILLAMSPIVLAQGIDNPADLQALIRIYNETNGRAWLRQTNWLNTSVSFCNWEGVLCTGAASDCPLYDQECWVAALDLSSNNVKGFSDAFCAFPNLTAINLENNTLAKDSLSSISRHCLGLRELRVNAAGLEEALPISLFTNLTSMVDLYLHDNRLFSSIPEAIANLISLRTIKLSNNAITGSIPRTIGALSSLQNLYLDQNLISGTLPVELQNLTLLSDINLSNNAITGTLPKELCNLANLQIVNFGLNKFVGTFPIEWTGMTGLFQIFLQANALTGGLPESLGNMVSLRTLNIENNQFNGTVPAAISSLANLEEVSLSGNRFVEGLPDFPLASFLMHISASGNSFNGTIPMSYFALTRLQTLDLSSNRLLTGEIHADIGNLTALKLLNLRLNSLSSSIPKSITRCTELAILNLASNFLNGTLSEDLWSLTNLEEVDFSNNSLSGMIPNVTANLTSMPSKLRRINFQGNLLTGMIPESMYLLQSLESLALGRNQIVGTISASISGLTKLKTLALSQNYLEGQLPVTLSKLDSLEFLQINQNRLSGQLPTQMLQKLLSLKTLELQQNQFTGNVNLFTSTFQPSFVNISFNQLGPRLEEYVVSTLPNNQRLLIFDYSNNAFECPYSTSYGVQIVSIRSPCSIPWSSYVAYAGGVLGAGTLAGAIFIVFGSKVLSNLGFARMSFFGDWSWEVTSFTFDVMAVWAMISYLRQEVDNCSKMNVYNIFKFYLPYRDYTIEPTSSVIGETLTFANFMSMWKSTLGYSENIKSFAAGCNSLGECSFDFSSLSCKLANPALSKMGDTRYQWFFVFLIVVLASRCCLELVRMVCVLISLCSDRVFRGRAGADFIRSSALAPLLILFKPDVFSEPIVTHRPKYTDYFRRIGYVGLVSVAPILIANLFFVLKVNQIGISFQTAVSTLSGVLILPWLIGQGVYGKFRSADAIDSTKTTEQLPEDQNQNQQEKTQTAQQIELVLNPLVAHSPTLAVQETAPHDDQRIATPNGASQPSPTAASALEAPQVLPTENDPNVSIQQPPPPRQRIRLKSMNVLHAISQPTVTSAGALQSSALQNPTVPDAATAANTSISSSSSPSVVAASPPVQRRISLASLKTSPLVFGRQMTIAK